VVEFGGPFEQAVGDVGAFPLAGRILVGLGQGRVNVNGAENLVEPKTMTHRQHILGNQITGVFTDDRHPEDPILAGHGQHLDEAMRLAVGNGAVEIIDAIAGDFVSDALLPGIAFIEADTGDFDQAWCAATWVNW